MGKDLLKHTELSLKDQNILKLNGVVNVESFEPEYVTLEISEGRICIEGSDLRIESLMSENGEIKITGKVNGLFYTAKKLRARFSRLFK